MGWVIQNLHSFQNRFQIFYFHGFWQLFYNSVDSFTHRKMVSRCDQNHIYSYSIIFWFKYDLGQTYQAPQVRPDRGSNSWPLVHDSTFHVTETPALTTWSSVTFLICQQVENLENMQHLLSLSTFYCLLHTKICLSPISCSSVAVEIKLKCSYPYVLFVMIVCHNVLQMHNVSPDEEL